MPIEVTNHSSGDTITYSLALLSGDILPSLPQGLITTYNALDPNNNLLWPVYNGTFKAIIPLKPGNNTIVLESGDEEVRIELIYHLPLREKFVRPIYIVCADDDGQFQGPENVDCSIQSACEKITLGTKLLQSFTAEKLHEHNVGRKTFALESEIDTSKPSCYVYRTKLKLNQAYNMSGGDLWMYFAKELMSSKEFERKDSCKWFAFMSFTRYAPPSPGILPRSHSEVLQFTKGHTALGGGGLALFGTGTLHTWASSLNDLTAHFTDTSKMDRSRFMDDSAYREYYWANYSTGLGASMHELGHTFDLAHTPTGVMARGFDDLYRVFTVQPLMNRRGSMCSSDMSRTASPIPYSPRQSPIHIARKRVNSTSSSRSNSPVSSPHFSSLPRTNTRSRTNSGSCSSASTSNEMLACVPGSTNNNNNNTFQIETDFKKLTVQTTQSFIIKNYDGSETRRTVTKYRDGMESVAEITKHTSGEQLIQETIKNLNSGKSRVVLSMTSVPQSCQSSNNHSMQSDKISHQYSSPAKTVSNTHTKTSTISSEKSLSKPISSPKTTDKLITMEKPPILSRITAVTNGIPTPINSEINLESGDDISAHGHDELSDSELNPGDDTIATSATSVQNHNIIATTVDTNLSSSSLKKAANYHHHLLNQHHHHLHHHTENSSSIMPVLSSALSKQQQMSSTMHLNNQHQGKNSASTATTTTTVGVQSPQHGNRTGIHEFRPRRKDGGAHWYRSSAVILSYHRWFNASDTTDDCKPPEFQGNIITSQCGLRLIEIRSLPEGVVVHHWEFLSPESPPVRFTLKYQDLCELLHQDTTTTTTAVKQDKQHQYFTVLALDDKGHIVKKKMNMREIMDE